MCTIALFQKDHSPICMYRVKNDPFVGKRGKLKHIFVPHVDGTAVKMQMLKKLKLKSHYFAAPQQQYTFMEKYIIAFFLAKSAYH